MPIVLDDEWSEEKNKIREGGRASDFDGFCWMARGNNQMKVSRIVGVYLGEVARRAKKIGEDAVTPFWPSDHGAKKIIITKFVMALEGRQSMIPHNSQPNKCRNDGDDIGHSIYIR